MWKSNHRFPHQHILSFKKKENLFMRLKKILLVASTLTVLSYSVLASADAGLGFANDTYKPVTFQLLSGSNTGSCAVNLTPPIPYTKAHSSSTITWDQISQVCSGSNGNICKVGIFVGDPCFGTPDATADIDLNSKSVTNVQNATYTAYNIAGIGAGFLITNA